MRNDTKVTKIGDSWKLVNYKEIVRLYGTTPITSALAKLHNFTEDAKGLAYINWACVRPKLENLPQNLRKGLVGLIKKEEELIPIPCCGKNFGLINDEEVDLRDYGVENRRRVTTVFCDGEDFCSNRESRYGMNSCGHYSKSEDIKEL